MDTSVDETIHTLFSRSCWDSASFLRPYDVLFALVRDPMDGGVCYCPDKIKIAPYCLDLVLPLAYFSRQTSLGRAVTPRAR